MFDIKLFAVACAAFFFVWRVFKKKQQVPHSQLLVAQTDAFCQEEEKEEALFQTQPHDILLNILANDAAVVAKLRASHTQNPVTIGRMPFNVLPISNLLISSEHAVIKWSAQEQCWKLKDVGSMNGTRLNELVISNEHRRPSEEHPLRNGDLILLAEAIKLSVSLVRPEVVPGGQIPQVERSPLRMAPRNGFINAQLPSQTSRLMTTRDHVTQPTRVQKTEQEEYFSDALDAEFAVLTQVGVEHWLSGRPSEDVVFWQLPFANFIHAGMFGVCDGHLGSAASTAIPHMFPSVFSDRINDSSNSLFASSSCAPFLHSAFLEVDSKLDTDTGSTATILLAERADHGEVYIQAANVGDSFGILINTNTGHFTALTADHRVANDKERERLQQLGNPMSKNSTRLYMLNLARAMGDTNLKKINPALIAVPYVSPVIRITANKAHLVVIASDGLWDCVGMQEVTNLAVQTVQNWEGLRAFGNALIRLATLERGAKDDISIFLTRL